tara:strand:+ start:611 stop:1432 length:822 start_codon:yes stop_codon:yes gene_type:complete
MKICIAGKNSIAVNATKHILDSNIIDRSDILSINNSDDVGVDSWQPSFLKFSNEQNLKVVSLDDLYSIDNLIFFSLEYNKIIKPNLFNNSTSLFNIHFSFLPAYKGMFTSAHPILNGEKFSGVTLHEMDKGIDTGNIIDQIKFEIDINDTARDLYNNYLKYSLEIFKRNINDLIANNYKSTNQTAIDSSYFSMNSINYHQLSIDFKKTSFEIHNQIRAYIFKEYQLPLINGYEIKKSKLTNDKIENNSLIEQSDSFIISGIDGFKIIAYKNEN